jgi:hypothetical protein
MIFPSEIADLPSHSLRFGDYSGELWRWAGVDSVWEQKNTRKCRTREAQSPSVQCTIIGWGHPISRKKQGCNGSILPIGGHISRTLALVSRKDSRSAPWFPITMIHQLVAL